MKTKKLSRESNDQKSVISPETVNRSGYRQLTSAQPKMQKTKPTKQTTKNDIL